MCVLVWKVNFYVWMSIVTWNGYQQLDKYEDYKLHTRTTVETAVETAVDSPSTKCIVIENFKRK